MREGYSEKLHKKMSMFLRWGYAALIALVVLLLLYLACFENISVSQTREDSGYLTIDQYTYQVIEDPEAPVGICREYRWMLDEIPAGGNSFAFYLIHHWAEVFVDGECIYQLTAADGNRVGGSIGCNWAMMRLQHSDIGKEITVRLYPVYENVAENEVTFLLGSQMQMYLDHMHGELPLIILCVLVIIVGLFFLSITVYDLYLKRKSRNLGYLGLFSIMIGLWKLADLKTSPMLFESNAMLLSYLSLSMLLVFTVAFMLFLKGEFNRYYLLFDCATALAVLYGIIAVILQITGTMDLKEILLVTHVMILLFVFAIAYLMIREGRNKEKDLRTKMNIACISLCAAGAFLDLGKYHIIQDSTGLQYTLTALFLYIVAKGIFSNRELTKRARIDRHTGLYNKNCCDEIIEEETILRRKVSLIMYDLNYLKRTNDTLGHKAGDRLIADFAGIIRYNTRKSDFAGRYGGDEFIIIASGADWDNTERIVENIAEAVGRYNAQSEQLNISYSVGFAVSGEFENATMHMLLEKADERMYLDKQKKHQEMEE